MVPMQISLPDLVGSNDDGLHRESNSTREHVGRGLKFLKGCKSFLKIQNKSTDQIDYLINILQEKTSLENLIQIADVDEKKIKKVIEKHPYFKNPCDYPIRLITIMKYLKKKGLNTNYKNIDLIVDRLIQEINGVKKVGDGMYLKR